MRPPDDRTITNHSANADVADADPRIDKRWVARRFNSAVDGYDDAAVLQRRVADRLVARLDVVRAQPNVILDAGCGTGYCTRLLSRRYRRARVIGLDLAWRMAARARRRAGWFARQKFVSGDVERLPFASGLFDMVVSNFMLPWCDPAMAIPELLRVLRPDGLLVLTTLGPDTLLEFRRAWREANPETRFHDFLDMHDVGDALVRAGFVEPVMDVERFTLTYSDLDRLLEERKAVSASSLAKPLRRGLAGRSRLERFRDAYAALAVDGRLPVTCEVVYGHAWVPAAAPGDRRVIKIRRV